MKCEQCSTHLSDYLDDELKMELSSQVSDHLEECQQCRSELEELRGVDQQMQQLRLPGQGIDAVVTALEPATPSTTSTAGGRIGREWPWYLMAAIAASIVMALLAIRPSDREPEPLPVAGRMVRATGSVELLPPGAQQWQRISPHEATPMRDGARVRTRPSVACEIETSAQAKLRLDQQTELILHSADRVEVVKGQVWCRTSDSRPLQVDTSAPFKEPGNPQAALPFSMTCPSDSEFQWNVGEDLSVCQSLSAEQQTDWQFPDFRCPVGPGERVTVDQQNNVQRSDSYVPATKLWQLPLLSINQAVDRELEEIVESMLVNIGRTKAGYMNEAQIRQLGPPGAIPLLAYVQSDRSRELAAVRHHAMRIAAELVDQSGADRLKELSRDDDQVVANYASEALKRVETRGAR